MIICTTPNDSILISLLLDSMTVPAERIDAPAGASIYVPDVDECLALYYDLDLIASPSDEPLHCIH